MQVELVRTTTDDGLRLDGALLEPTCQPQLSLDAAICLHGVASSFHAPGLMEKIAPALRGLGLKVLWANTRGHDLVYTAYQNGQAVRYGAAYEIVDQGRLDIAAWVRELAARGMSRIVLVGHSLGAIKSVYTLAHDALPEVKAIVAASPPRLSYAAFMAAAAPGFVEAMRRAEKLVAANQKEELLEVTFPYPMLITAAAYVDKYGRAERYNMFKFAGRLLCPTLFTFGELEVSDGNPAFAGVPEALLQLRCADQVLDVTTIAGANHLYSGVQEKLGEDIAEWLKRIARRD